MKKVSFLIFTSLLSGCSFFEQEPPLPLYTLKSQIFEQSNALSVPLIVDLPLTEASLNSTRIAVTPAPYQRDYLANSQWPDKLPKVFQEVVFDSLNQRWGSGYVNRFGAGLQAKYILHSEIQDFSFYLNMPRPEVQQRVIFKLIDMRDRRVIAGRSFTQITPVCAVTVKEIVKAFNIGLNDLLADAIQWMEEEFLKKRAFNS